MELIKTKTYFIKLMNAANLYLFIWSIGNSDFNNWEKNETKEFFFIHAVDRIKFYLLGRDKIEKLKWKKYSYYLLMYKNKNLE